MSLFNIQDIVNKLVFCKTFLIIDLFFDNLLQNLTGGIDDGLYITDVTNASRTMLMNIETLSWDPTLCRYFDIPMQMLPEIRSSSEIYGKISIPPLSGIPISGVCKILR